MSKEEHYKFTITINQKKYVDLNIKITYELASLFYNIADFCKEDHEKISSNRVDGYTWLSYKKIHKDMPLLKGKTEASITGQIKKLEKLNLITTLLKTKKGRPRKYIKLTSLGFNVSEKSTDEYNEKYYHKFRGLGMNKKQAIEIAGYEKFLEEKGGMIEKVIRSTKIENKPGYIYEQYKTYCDFN